jgi:hypothetical protein
MFDDFSLAQNVVCWFRLVDSSYYDEEDFIMSNKKAYDQKHLTTTQRIKIEKGLNDGLSFAAIARTIDKHPSAIIKEVKKYRFFPPRDNPEKNFGAVAIKNARCVFFATIRTASILVKTVMTQNSVFQNVFFYALTIWNLSVRRFKRLLMSVMVV